MKQVTKAEFDFAQAKYPPNGWTKLAYKYFSTDTKPEDKDVRRAFLIPMIILFVIGFGCTVLSVANILVMFATVSYAFGLLLLGVFMFAAFLMNNFRLRKVRKELGLTRSEYEQIRQLYSDTVGALSISKGFY